MAIDNLNFYSAWLPAGQQTDRYSSQPWCLRSKNLDIFSSSKSVKATAWSEPVELEEEIIASEWWLELRADGKVYDSEWTLIIDPSQNFLSYKVSYTWVNGTYTNAEWGTVQDMSVLTENGERKSFVVYTDRASFTYSKVKFVPEKKVSWAWYTVDTEYDGTNSIRRSTTSWAGTISINCGDTGFSMIPLKIDKLSGEQTVQNIRILKRKYVYDAELDAMTGYNDGVEYITNSYTFWETIYVPNIPWSSIYIDLTDCGAIWSKVRININNPDDFDTYGHYMIWDWDYNGYYSYLPVRDRELSPVWEYYWMKSASFQILYNWVGYWVNVNWEKKTRYDFVQYMWWANDPWMDVIWMVVWNEKVYMIWNLDWNGYIIPCDLSWGRWTPFIAYGCEFKGVTNIDYLMYLVWDDRGVSQLLVYNWQELVPAIWWREEKDSKNLIKDEEQYKFDWKILNWRKNLILTTEDNRIFQYGQTYGGKWWAFIHELPWAIKELKSDWNDLVVKFLEPTPRPIDQSSWADMVALRSNVALYSESGEELWTISIPRNANTASDVISLYWDEYWFTWLSLTLNWDKLNDGYKFNEDIEQVYIVSDYLWVDKTTTYQDDTPIKNYNTEWMAEYPIVLWNHLLEKEESDLYVSYILPSKDCSLEFWGMANHYHFRTFTSEDDYTFDSELSYKLKWATWDYELKFIERNGNQYTFRLEWDLPIQTTNDMKITDSEWVELINYSEYNHFRKIGEITTIEYQEWEFRFHNLNNKLELPKSHSLQIMVKGKGNQNYTPELFALDLVANQRERW